VKKTAKELGKAITGIAEPVVEDNDSTGQILGSLLKGKQRMEEMKSKQTAFLFFSHFILFSFSSNWRKQRNCIRQCTWRIGMKNGKTFLEPKKLDLQ
jgi:HJR/Mrr/RecB family endonuclease